MQRWDPVVGELARVIEKLEASVTKYGSWKDDRGATLKSSHLQMKVSCYFENFWL